MMRSIKTVALCALLLTGAACRGTGGLPEPSSVEYRNAVSTFYVGLAALQAGDDPRAKEKFLLASGLAPGEPAVWANLGLLALRQRDLDAAEEYLGKARELAPDDSRIFLLLGTFESSRGNFDQAVAHLRRAVELDPKNLKAAYALAQEIERGAGENSEAEAQNLYERMLEVQPDNLAIQLELTRLAAKRGDAATLRRVVGQLAGRTAAWTPEAREQFAALQAAAAGPDVRAAASRVAFLRNVLVRVPEYRQSLAAAKSSTEAGGEPFTRFLLLQSPNPAPALPDTALAFATEPAEAGAAEWIGLVSWTGEGAPAVVTANGREVRVTGGATLAFPGGPSAAPPGPHGVLAVDLNYDFKLDLVLAGAGGLRLYRQGSPAAFTDVTGAAGLSAEVTSAAYTGAWALDLDLDGDLDVLLGLASGPPRAIRNNGDGTFKELRPFEGVSGLGGLARADVDADGDPDVALLDAQGTLHMFANERLGQFRPRPLPQELGRALAVAVADTNADAVMELVALGADGAIRRLSDKGQGSDWETAELARWEGASDGPARLLIEDLDNNGAIDLLAAGSGSWRVWLGDEMGGFQPLAVAPGARVLAAGDLTGDGRLDLVGLSGAGQPVRLVNSGSKSYHWQTLRPRAKEATGDQRINSFGIGGEMEIRSGLLFQKQAIDGPLVHFGLGENESTDVVRIVWPNGAVQAEFELGSDQAVLAEQRLKGSCPSLFAWDGTGMRFVKDCAPWSPALGLRINDQDTAGILQTEEWMKIRGDQLVARDGYYDLRITAELWETYYIDHYSLVVVDHPAGTEIFTDERFAVPPPPLAVYTVAPPRPVTRALDDGGRDVTATVRALDGEYLDTFGRGAYQGVTRDHWVEVELGDDAPEDGPLWLIAEGWLHPTDGSVNVARGQGRHEPPRGLNLEVADASGGWAVAREGLGFPAGKNKTVVIDLAGVFRPGQPRRLRLRTNMEIYWDRLEWAAGLPDARIRTERLSPETAELRYRGFSAMGQANRSSPELPDYERIAQTTQRWRDLVGYYTRFGDIRELLAGADERFVIVNAGDEMAFRFAAPPPPPDGWARDFVLVGNGWIKDGDYNSVFGKTVIPLPGLDTRDYTTPPGRLEDDPVYRRHAEDWQAYHTRYVTPDAFRNALRVD
jgi:Tfp pilus assembly protein PilF